MSLNVIWGFVSPLLVIAAMAGAVPGRSGEAFAQVAAPEVARSANGPGTASTAAMPKQQGLPGASIAKRVRLAEQLGEAGARYLAHENGYKPIFDGTARALVQGPDQVYQGLGGVVHVFEAKGESSKLGHAYGYAQGTPEWAVESAKRVLRSAQATPAERLGSEATLRAAAKGKLDVHVVRTTHEMGPAIERTLRSTERSAKVAQTALSGLARQSTQGTDNVARGLRGATKALAATSPALKTTTKAAVVVGVAVDAALRVEDAIKTEQRFASGEISQEEREVAHAKNGAGMAGGWGGAIAGAKLGGAAGGAAGTLVAPGPGTTIGAAVGGMAGGVGGYFAGEAVAEASVEWATEQVHACGTTIKESASNAWDWTTRSCQSGWESIVGK